MTAFTGYLHDYWSILKTFLTLKYTSISIVAILSVTSILKYDKILVSIVDTGKDIKTLSKYVHFADPYLGYMSESILNLL